MAKTMTKEEILKNKKIKRRKNRTFVMGLIVLLLLITIGYASLATVLNINGNTTIGKVQWDVHFQNVQEITKNCTVLKQATIVDADKTKIEYTIRLDSLKQKYEFTTDIVNGGTLNANLESAVLGGMSEEAQKYLDYTVTYADGRPVKAGDKLNVGGKETLRVIVAFKENLTKDNLPSKEETFTLTYTMNYVQE